MKKRPTLKQTTDNTDGTDISECLSRRSRSKADDAAAPLSFADSPSRRLAVSSFVRCLALTCFALGALALAQWAHAVVPAPDGGYSGGNTAEGQDALLSLTDGTFNTALGFFSLLSVTDANFNTGVGAGTLLANTADENTATGAGALLSNTTGEQNTANGAFALFSNTEGFQNTATGFQALFSNTTGSFNDATGRNALFSNTAGDSNSATGFAALRANTTGTNNTAVGVVALFTNTTGGGNTAVGTDALSDNTTGDNNTALGQLAGRDITGSGNVCIGELVVGEAGVDDRTYIRNVDTLVQNFSAGVNDYVTVRLSDGRLGHTAVVSSQRYKEDIKPLDATSHSLYALKPVSFRLKKQFDPTQALGFGLIAEEVEKIDPALVYRNDKGQVESVRYDMVNAMLLNEFLKEHKAFVEERERVKAQDRTMREQEATIAELKSHITQQCRAIQAVMAQLREQAAQIQMVNAQVKLNRAAPQQTARVIP
jgi:hypothetical protein